MKSTFPSLFTAVTLLSLAACSSMPTGPSILVLPGPGKNFDDFRADDLKCRQYALGHIGGGAAGQAASGETKTVGYDAQQSYDMSYIQCMFASGDRVPVSGTFIDDSMLGGDQFSFQTPLPPLPPESLLPPPNPDQAIPGMPEQH